MKLLPRLAALAILTLARSAFGSPTEAAAEGPSTATPAPAQGDLRQARIHFGRGVQLYRERNFLAALAEFNRAYALGPSYRILYNIGQAQLEAQDCPAALKTFARYRADGGAELSEEKQGEITAAITACSARVAEITVGVITSNDAPGAEIFVDDISVGTAPLREPLVVGAGRRRLSAVIAGLPPAVRVVEVAGGDHLAIELSIVGPVHADAPRAIALAPLPAHVAPAPAPSRTAFWVSLGVTGALGAATLATGLRSLSAKDRLRGELDTFPTDDAAVRAARTDLKTTALVTDVLGAAALLGVGVTTYFAVTTLTTRKGDSVRVGVGPGSIAAEGRF